LKTKKKELHSSIGGGGGRGMNMPNLAIVQVWHLFSNKVTKPKTNLLSLFVAVACFVSVAL